MFKDNLKSKFTKYINRRNFGNMVDSAGAVVVSNGSVNMGDLTINYTLPVLTGLKDTATGTNQAKWYKWPIVYIFDPTGQAAADKLEGSYQSGGNMYSVFNKSIATSVTLFRNAVMPSTLPTSTATTQTTANSTTFTESNYPVNLINTGAYYTTGNVNTSTTLLSNYITTWSATLTSGSVTVDTTTGTLTPSQLAAITMSVTFSGAKECIWSPMVNGRTYIVGISNATNAYRSATVPANAFPYNGRCSNFVYKSFTASSDSPITVTFDSVSATTLGV